MMSPRPFEPWLVRQRKRRASKGFREAAFLHARVAADLADRLEAIPRPFSNVLAIGGDSLFSAELRKRPALAARIGRVIEADLAGGDVIIDQERPPFADGAFDLIVSLLVLHSVNDAPGVLTLMRRMLAPDGLLLASLFGGDTLTELRASLLQAEEEILSGAGARLSQDYRILRICCNAPDSLCQPPIAMSSPWVMMRLYAYSPTCAPWARLPRSANVIRAA